MHTISSVLSTVERGDYAFKTDLQDAYFHVLIHPDSRKYLCFALKNKVYTPVSSTSLRSKHCLSGICLGHTVAAYLHHQGILVIPYLDDWLIHHPDRQALLRHQSQFLNMLNMVGLRLNEAKSKLEPVQDIQFLGLQLHLDQGRASLPVSKAREIMAHECLIFSQKTLSYAEVSQFMGSLNWALGLMLLGHLHLRLLQRHFHSLGVTNLFSPPWRSDPSVLATLLMQWQNLSFLASGIPIRPFQAEFTIFTDASSQGWGAYMVDSQIAGVWTHSERKIHINVLELRAVILALHHRVTVLQGHHFFIATDNTTVVAYINKQGGDPFPPSVAAGSGSVSVATDLGHNSKSQTHSGLPKCDSRPLVSAEPANHDRVESPTQSRESDFQTVGNSSS